MRELGNVFNDGTVWMLTHKRETHAFMVGLDTDVAAIGSGIRAHRADFVYLAHDVVTAGKAVAGLAEGVLLLGSAALTAYGKIHQAVDWILKIDPFKTPADQFGDHTSLTTERDVLYNGLRNKHLALVPAAPQVPIAAAISEFISAAADFFKHHGMTGAPPFAAPHNPAPPAPPHGDPKRDVHHHTVGPVSIIIQGAGKDAKEIADAVDARLQDVFGNPRSLQNSSGESRTHRALPSILTKAIA